MADAAKRGERERAARGNSLENRVYITVFYFPPSYLPFSFFFLSTCFLISLSRGLAPSLGVAVPLGLAVPLAGIETPGNDHYLRYSDK